MAKSFLKNRLEYGLFRILAAFLRLLPRRAAFFVGKAMGRLYGLLPSKRKRRALDNMRRAIPEMTDTEVRAQVAAMYGHLGASGVEMLRLDLLTRQDLDRYFRFQGLENLREALKLEKGAILLSGHVGFWEVGTISLPMLGFPVDFVAKRMKNPRVDRFFSRMRESSGGRLLDSRKGARRILKSLAENRVVGVLLDQHVSPRAGVCIEFFNRPAHTTPIITQLAMKYGIPVVPGFSRRTDDNCYEVVLEPMILLENESSPESVLKNTALLSSYIEKAIRRDVSQWFWLHRRWRDCCEISGRPNATESP